MTKSHHKWRQPSGEKKKSSHWDHPIVVCEACKLERRMEDGRPVYYLLDGSKQIDPRIMPVCQAPVTEAGAATTEEAVSKDRLKALACGAGGPLKKGEVAEIARQLLEKRRDEEPLAKPIVIDVPPGTFDAAVMAEVKRLTEENERMRKALQGIRDTLKPYPEGHKTTDDSGDEGLTDAGVAGIEEFVAMGLATGA